ncbi:hypothetical protein [Azospirillum endophyticum]
MTVEGRKRIPLSCEIRRCVPEADALSDVAGYRLLNDVSERALQMQHPK